MSINNDLISVIIPAYNHEKYVQDAIKSIINQTYKNLELIIVDDGSADNTWGKINELKEEGDNRFVRFLLKRQKNSGTIKTLDDTLYIARGKYIYYIASDDVAHPNAIEILHKNIGNAGLIFPDIAWIDSAGNRFFLNEHFEPIYDINEAKYKTLHEAYLNRVWPNVDSTEFNFYANLISGNYSNIGFLLLKQAAIDAGGWNKDTIIEDYYMHLQIAKRCKMKRIKDILFFYRRHDNNWSSNSLEMQEGVKRIFMNERKYCYKNGYMEIWNEIFKERYYKESSFLEKSKFKINDFIYKNI
jgi:alpha-1,3-rhamnosyltransferase